MQHSDPDENIVCLLGAVEHGDQDATCEVWEDHYDPLVRMIGQWFGRRRRPAADEEDLAVDVLDDVIRRIQRGKCRDIVLEREFSALVLVTARHRFMTQRMFDFRQKRCAEPGPPDAAPKEAAARNSGPADDASETLDDLLSIMSMPRDKTLWCILMQIVADYSKPQIAENLHISRRTLDRLLHAFEERWKKHINGEHMPKHVESWADFAKLVAERDRNIAARSAAASPSRPPPRISARALAKYELVG